MDWLTTLGMAMGSAWLSGINLYATVLTLGLLERFKLVTLPGEMHVLGEWWVLGLAGALYVVEFVADKIPAVDSVWDAIHTFIRVPAGAIIAASAFAQFDPAVRAAALLVGGGIALSSHGAKAATRLAANASPEPVSNVALSLAEDVLTVGSAVLMVFHPVVILVVVLIFLVVVAWLAPKIWRALKRLRDRLRGLFRPGPATGAASRCLAAALALLLAGAAVPAQTREPDARGAVRAFFELLKTQQYAALYDYLPADLQRQLTREQLTQSLQRLGQFIAIERLEIGRVQQRGDLAVIDTTIYGTLKRPFEFDGQRVDAGRVAVQQYLFREGDRWKVATADSNTRDAFLRRHPEFDRQFQFTNPQFAIKQNGQWKPFGRTAGGQ
ncbi:MAG TPA: DUF4126 family protein [Blastocatellia bacterium]|nr:DUF4126 family protein [Blastocatellia bacterium]